METKQRGKSSYLNELSFGLWHFNNNIFIFQLFENAVDAEVVLSVHVVFDLKRLSDSFRLIRVLFVFGGASL